MLLDLQCFQAFEKTPHFFDCDFHTGRVLSTGASKDAQQLHSERLRDDFEGQFINYPFWLANTIETQQSGD
jgi:hypothetical protein